MHFDTMSKASQFDVYKDLKTCTNSKEILQNVQLHPKLNKKRHYCNISKCE